MLQASRLHLKEGQLTTIAGASGGKRVTCSNQALPIYNDLYLLAKEGNYWAGLVVRGIRGLTSGRLSMDNIYIEKENNLTCGRGVFYLVLPGITATLEDCSDGTYQVRGLEADTRYMQLQHEQKKPGLWRINSDENTRPDPVKNGEISKKDNRSVVISDPSKSLDEEIEVARNDLKKVNSTISINVNITGFDLHFTPSKGNLFGLKPAKKASETKEDQLITESAILLANTMYKARNVNGVLWFSHWGGSIVLTRAMQILKQEKSIKLNKHCIFLHRPTSNSATALALAKELNITPAEGGKHTGLTMREIKGNHMSARMDRNEIGKTSAFGLSLAGTAFGVAGLFGGAPAGGAIVTLMGAMYFVTTTALSAKQKLAGKKQK